MKLEQIKKKVRYGDYVTLSEMLNTTADSAKMRIRRKDKIATDALIAIIKSRERLIRRYKKNSK